MKFISIIIIYLLFYMQVSADECMPQTPAFEHMQEKFIEIVDDQGESILLKVKIADDNAEQAAGFQFICPDVIDVTAILFIFERAKTPLFHMNNVFADLDIAFIDIEGRIADIQTMNEERSTGVRKLYPSDVVTKYALEVPAGFFSENNITTQNSRLKIDG